MLTRLGELCADFCVRHRVPVLVVGVLLVAACVYPATTIPYDASYEGWFLDSDPAKLAYAEFHDLFGNDEFLLLTLEVEEGTVFRNPTLESIERTTRFLENSPDVIGVMGLTRFEGMQGADDELSLRPAVPELPMTESALTEAESWVLEDPLATGFVVTPNGRVAVVTAEIEYAGGDMNRKYALVDTVRSFLAREELRSGFHYDLVGTTVTDQAMARKSKRDVNRNVPLVGLITGLVLLITVRSISASVLTVSTVMGAIILARSFIPLFGWRDNSMLLLVPVVILAIGVADGVHIAVQFVRARGDGASGPEAARQSVRDLFRPCFLTSFTTMIGFGALATTSLAPLRQLGVITSIGVFIAFLLSVIFLPAALSLLPGNFRARRERLERGAVSRLVMALPGFLGRHRRAVLVASVLITVAGLAGIPRLQVQSNVIDAFYPNDPIRVVGEKIEKQVGGTGSLEVVITAPQPGGIRDPQVLRAIEDLGRFLESSPLISGTHSVVDQLEAVHQAMHGGDPKFHRVPETSAQVAQYLLLYESASPRRGLDRIVDLTQTTARLSARAKFGTGKEYRELQEAALEFASGRFPPGVTLEFTGVVTLYKNMAEYILWSQIRSFGFAMVLITITLMLTFWSWRIGLLSLIPNVWPILLTVGYMGWSHTYLVPSTAMVAAVALGIAVDDTVHFLTKYLQAVKRGDTNSQAVTHAFHVSGRAIVFTTLILLGAFVTIGFSGFKPYTNFGRLTAIALFLALVGDLFVLPAIFLGYRPVTGPKRGRKRGAAAGLVLLLLAPTTAGAQDGSADTTEDPAPRGRAVMEAVDHARHSVEAERMEVDMILRDHGGREVTRRTEMAFWNPAGAEGRSLVRFLSPPDLRGTAFLTHEKPGDDDRWLYLPGVGRVKRIAASSKAASFAGTEFTYEDLGGREIDAYRHRWLEETQLDGELVDVVESVPDDTHSGYSRLVSWVSREKLVFLKVDYYDRQDRLLKHTTAHDLTLGEDGLWHADRLVMENAQSGKSTEIHVLERDFDPSFDESAFTVESLRAEW